MQAKWVESCHMIIGIKRKCGHTSDVTSKPIDWCGLEGTDWTDLSSPCPDKTGYPFNIGFLFGSCTLRLELSTDTYLQQTTHRSIQLFRSRMKSFLFYMAWANSNHKHLLLPVSYAHPTAHRWACRGTGEVSTRLSKGGWNTFISPNFVIACSGDKPGQWMMDQLCVGTGELPLRAREGMKLGDPSPEIMEKRHVCEREARLAWFKP